LIVYIRQQFFSCHLLAVRLRHSLAPFPLVNAELSGRIVCRYVDRLTANLEKLMSDAEKMSSMSRLMATRRGESVEEQQSLEPQLELFRRRTKELQKQV
jgi:hypothetical protein